MRECPILFSPWSVQRILAGAKWETRRVITPQPEWDAEVTRTSILGPLAFPIGSFGQQCGAPIFVDGRTDGVFHVRNPYGAIGDLLWVKEPFSLGKAQDGRTPAEAWEHVKETKQGLTVLYRAGGWKSVAPFEREEPTYPDNEPLPEWAGRRRHGMFMPRWASRITLEITEVRVQRVQEISEEDAIAEGCEPTKYTEYDIHDIQISDAAPHIKELAKILGPCKVTAKADYMRVWDEINGKDHPWSSNPFCWCISFRRLEAQ